MRADDFLTEADVVDKLKGTSRNVERRRRRRAMATTSPASNLGVNLTDPRTAVGSIGKGGSPEYQEYMKQKEKNTPATNTWAPMFPQSQKPSTAKTTTKTPTSTIPDDPRVAKAKKALGITSTTDADAIPNLNQRRLASSIVTSINSITDPQLLQSIKTALDAKVK